MAVAAAQPVFAEGCLTGANGRGKTSLLRIVCGLLAPQAGEVRWKGEPIGALREEYSSQLVYLGHAPAVKDELTAVRTNAAAGQGADPLALLAARAAA